MSGPDLPPFVLPGGAPAPAAGGNGKATAGSLLSSLRIAANRQQEERHLELDVPGEFRGLMRIRYHGLPLDGLERYSELLATGRTTNLSTVLDMISTCCEAVLGFDAEEDKWIVLCDELGPVGLDDRLATLLNMPHTGPPGMDRGPREVIELLFMPGGNSVPLGNHAGELATWLSDTKGLEPGESSAATGSPLLAKPRPSE
jgi:hypothetical protein